MLLLFLLLRVFRMRASSCLCFSFFRFAVRSSVKLPEKYSYSGGFSSFSIRLQSKHNSVACDSHFEFLLENPLYAQNISRRTYFAQVLKFPIFFDKSFSVRTKKAQHLAGFRL